MLKNEKGISRIALIIIIALVIVGGAIAVVSVMNKDENSNIINQANDSKQNIWGLKINGKSITLPCTLADLAEADVHIYSEYDREQVLSSVNQTFTMIQATCGDGMNPIFLKIETGENSNKREENATVKIITNNKMMQKDEFILKNNVGLGSSVDDVINTFGSNYTVDSSQSDDLHKGFVMMHYGDSESGVLFWFTDNVLTYIEIYDKTK